MRTGPVSSPEGRSAPSLRLVSFLACDDAHLLNMAGPCEAFAAANRLLRERRPPGAPEQTGYRMIALSVDGGVVSSASGLEISTKPLSSQDGAVFDTIIIPGGADARPVMADDALLSWLRRAMQRARRTAAFGGGVFALAQAGLLDGRRCVTHWSLEDRLHRDYPQTIVVADALFVRDGACLTAAGSSASVDLALHMIEEDFDRALALEVARMLVVPHMRPGEQPQLSAELRAQQAAAPRIAQAAQWIARHIDQRPTISSIASRFAMSERNFCRVFTREMGMPPQRFIEQARLETARRWLAGSQLPIEKVARRSGFTSGDRLTQAFKKIMNTTPLDYRRLNGAGAQKPGIERLNGNGDDKTARAGERERRQTVH